MIKKKNLFYSNFSSIKYYNKNRNKIKDLYRSEKAFFIKAIKKNKNIVDFGCAIGNFIKIIKQIKKDKFDYIGLDNQPKLIKIAKKKFPKKKFYLIKSWRFPLKSKYDLVFSFGVLHHLKDWKKYIKSMKKISKKYLLFDVRLIKGRTVNSNKQYQKICFNDKWDGFSKIRYITINKNEFKKFLISELSEYKIKILSYKNNVSENYVGKFKKVWMTTILAEKIQT